MYGKRGNRTDLSKKKWADMATEQQGKGCNREQTVKAVQHTAVTGEQISKILNSLAALHGRHGQISKLSNDGG